MLRRLQGGQCVLAGDRAGAPVGIRDGDPKGALAEPGLHELRRAEPLALEERRQRKLHSAREARRIGSGSASRVAPAIRRRFSQS